MAWSCKHFSELSNEELYKILQLRNQVFVVEQKCAYQDCDDKDQLSFHLMGFDNDTLAAYSRLLAPGVAFSEPSIGRVVTSRAVRGNKIGQKLMIESISQIYKLFGKSSIAIGAQLYLKGFYQSFGFIQTSDTYLEDGIEHIHMLLK